MPGRLRTAVITAFAPEWDVLAQRMDGAEAHRVNGMTLLAGTLAGRDVVLAESGVSMVNAAMNTQALLDRFAVGRILFSGVAGGVDPALEIGDVVVPSRWGQNLEVAFARGAERFVSPINGFEAVLPPFGAMHPRGVLIATAAAPTQPYLWLDADPALLALAERVATGVTLAPIPDGAGGPGRAPRVVVGGNAVSSPAFVDNPEYRRYLEQVFGARLVDMESAAVAQVALANAVPFLAFRSLSDLAGGEAGENRVAAFMGLAAENCAAVVCAFLRPLAD